MTKLMCENILWTIAYGFLRGATRENIMNFLIQVLVSVLTYVVLDVGVCAPVQQRLDDRLPVEGARDVEGGVMVLEESGGDFNAGGKERYEVISFFC